MSGSGTNATSQNVRFSSAYEAGADMPLTSADFAFDPKQTWNPADKNSELDGVQPAATSGPNYRELSGQQK